ncbi:MAG: glycoside hydrolase family 3 C-terminal domain-containing protein [Lachnospiraceae bacterium]|nr:glycoside hydrolase family 3 C-terminal domain-containing protein [Lachnospiraceae bacterium]
MEQAKKKKIVIGVVAGLILICAIFAFCYKNVFMKSADEKQEVAQTTEEAEAEVPEADIPAEPEEEVFTGYVDPVDPNAEADKSVYMDAAQDIETRIDALMAQMTLRDKAAQMVQPEQSAISLAEITEYNVGSILSGGGSAPNRSNAVNGWQYGVDSMKFVSLQSRLGIPLLYGVDAVHGHSNVSDATMFPHNIGLGSADDEELMEQMGAIVAKEVKATGIQWTFAPTLANPRNELWGRTYEGFGEEVDIVARLGAAFIRGAQGESSSEEYLDADHVLATAKHYIGEGYTKDGTNQGDVVMSDEEFDKLLHDTLLVPYKAALDAGARTVMVSYSSVDGVKCHENGYLINDVLKGELGFTGLVVSDYNGIQQVSGNTYKDQVALSVNAGIDLFMEPNTWKQFIDTLVELVEEGRVPIERVDDAVRRILRVKLEAGLFEETIGSEHEVALIGEFGNEEHREVARALVRKSLVLLKNDAMGAQTAMEALSSAKHILVTGSKADDIGAQCGGWTISWQGSRGDITSGTTILEGLQAAAGGKNITYNDNGEVAADTDAVIVVVGEVPYAETQGDRSSSNLTITGDDKELIEQLKASLQAAGKEDIPVIALLLIGRPVTIADYVEDFDAIVTAWLPGTEGEGVADVLLGDYDFTGTLTYTWPWYASDIAEKFDDESLVLFKRGTGLNKAGESLKAEGTTQIGEKPAKSDEELAAIQGGLINLESTGYVLEAEVCNEDSYLVELGNANNISYVDNWGGEWANAKWNVLVPEAGEYTLHFYIAAAKDSNSVDIYYAPGQITDDGAANRTNVPMTKTADMLDYQDFTLDVKLDAGEYEFKFMNSVTNGADFRLDRIEFERH